MRIILSEMTFFNSNAFFRLIKMEIVFVPNAIKLSLTESKKQRKKNLPPKYLIEEASVSRGYTVILYIKQCKI